MAGVIEDGWRQENSIGCWSIDCTMANRIGALFFPSTVLPGKNEKPGKGSILGGGSHDVMMRT